MGPISDSIVHRQ